MLNNEYLSGTTLKIYAHLKDESGTGVSADSLTFYMTEPGGIGHTYYYNVGSGQIQWAYIINNGLHLELVLTNILGKPQEQYKLLTKVFLK